MKKWQIHEAKAKLTQLVNEAKLAPQIISRHGVDETIILNIETYKKLVSADDNLVSFFKNSPLYGLKVDIIRDKSNMRDVDL